MSTEKKTAKCNVSEKQDSDGNNTSLHNPISEMLGFGIPLPWKNR